MSSLDRTGLRVLLSDHTGGGSNCPVIRVPASATTDWIDVGYLIDVFNHGQWGFMAGNYSIEVGVREANAAGLAAGVHSIATFATGLGGHPFEMLFDASTRATKRMRPQTDDMYELLAALEKQTPTLIPTRGLPSHVPVFGGFFDKIPTVVQNVSPDDGLEPVAVCARCGAEYSAMYEKLDGMFGINGEKAGNLSTGADPVRPLQLH